MRCPYCGNLDDKVLESRTMINGESIRRRRECLACGYRFTSYERIDEKPFMVVKRDGRRQPFDRAKLEKGIERALEKRPVSTSMVEQLSNDIEDLAIKKMMMTHVASKGMQRSLFSRFRQILTYKCEWYSKKINLS